MDDVNSSFGRLSTKASEWKPTSSASSSSLTGSSDAQSDLKATAVKEFVPGRAWTAGGAAVHASSPSAHQGSYDEADEDEIQKEEPESRLEDEYDTTVPTGAAPPPLPAFRALHSLGVPDDMWRHNRELTLESMRQMEPSDPLHKAIPPPYCNGYCLDTSHQGRSSFGYPSSTFLVTSREDGHLYCLRRFDNVRSVSPKIAAAVTERWTSSASAQEHPGVVPFYQCFVAQRAIFFVHQYIPGARSLQERLGGPFSEQLLWSCVAQLVSAIRTVHASKLAVRSLKLQHILSNSDSMGSRLRLRLNCVGVIDALEFEARKNVSDLQERDIRDLGRIILSLATGSEVTSETDDSAMGRCESFLTQNYSRDMHNLAMTLIRSNPRPPSILDVSRAIAQRAFDEQDAAYTSLDRAERALSAEYESGRGLRLLLKLGFINERPEVGQNRRWAQTGDCYVLTLFRDYVFHQADGGGNPVMDLGHVTAALNKLDAADEEKIVLASRDGKSLMVVSYADVARCLENAYHELCSGSIPPSTALQY